MPTLISAPMMKLVKNRDLPDLYQVWSPDFTAGLEIDKSDERCINAAPILYRRFIGKKFKYIEAVCKNRHWTLEKLTD